MHKRFGLSGLAILGIMAGAAAQAETRPGFYAGAGIGEATIEVDEVGFDESDTAFKIFGGYAFNDYFAVELTYFDGGAPEARFGTGSVDVEVSGLTASAVGRLPLGESLSLFGKLGFTSYDFEVTGRVNNQTIVAGDGSDEDVAYGIGAAFSFAQRFELRAEYETIDLSDADFNVISVTGLYRF